MAAGRPVSARSTRLARYGSAVLGTAVGLAGGAAAVAGSPTTEHGWSWQLPAGFPVPAVPADQPITAAKVELGRHLFHDRRLSGNGTQSCADCHRPELAFTDGRARALGSTGERHHRSSMSLVNVAYNRSHTWADPTVVTLEQQAVVPMLNEHPVEMGVTGRADQVLAQLRAEPRYRELFAQAFPNERVASDLEQLARAIAAFERTIISGRSAYDRLLYDDQADALSASAWRGMELFFSDRLGCAQCHGGFNFSGPIRWRDGTDEPRFHDTALHPEAVYADGDAGLAAISGDDHDRGKFRAPTLRNIALTAPYMHDGSLADLDQVIDHYAAGGRAARASINRSPHLKGFATTGRDKRDLIEFLRSLTDDAFLDDPRYKNPWPVRANAGYESSAPPSTSTTVPMTVSTTSLGCRRSRSPISTAACTSFARTTAHASGETIPSSGRHVMPVDPTVSLSHRDDGCRGSGAADEQREIVGVARDDVVPPVGDQGDSGVDRVAGSGGAAQRARGSAELIVDVHGFDRAQQPRQAGLSSERVTPYPSDHHGVSAQAQSGIECDPQPRRHGTIVSVDGDQRACVKNERGHGTRPSSRPSSTRADRISVELSGPRRRSKSSR